MPLMTQTVPIAKLTDPTGKNAPEDVAALQAIINAGLTEALRLLMQQGMDGQEALDELHRLIGSEGDD